MDDSVFLQQIQSDLDGISDLDDLEEVPGVAEVVASSESGITSDFQEIPEIEDSDDLDALEESNTKLSQFAVPLNFNMEEVTNDFAEQLAALELSGNEAEASDIITMKNILVECQQAGMDISGIDNLEDAKCLQAYTKEIQQHPNVSAEFSSYYNKMLLNLTHSTALHVKTAVNLQQFKATLLKSVHDSDLQQICGRIITLVWAHAESATASKNVMDLKAQDIDADKIFMTILTDKSFQPDGKDSTVLINFHEPQIRTFINTAISTIVNAKISDAISSSQSFSRREQMSKTLTAEESKVIQEIAKKNYSFITRIDATNGGDMYCTCSKCGKKTRVKSLMHFVCFQNKEIKRYVYPSLNVCECGAMLMFPLQTYLHACDYFASNYKGSIRSAIDKASGFGMGAAVISITPALHQLPPEITCIVHDSEKMTSHHEEQIVETFDDEEWRKAVADFYNHLALLECNVEAMPASSTVSDALEDTTAVTLQDDNADVLSDTNYDILNNTKSVSTADRNYVSILAANVTQVAGVSYNITKGKALVSLMMYLDNNKHTQHLMNFDNVLSVNAALHLVDMYTKNADFDLNKISDILFANLMIVAGMIDAQIEVPTDKNVMKEFFKQHYAELQEIVSNTNASYAEFAEDLEKSKQALAFVPIVDYKQVSIVSLMQFLPNEPIFDTVNEICDRMIINAYTMEYFNYWCRLELQHSKTLYSRLLNSADIKSIFSVVHDVIEDDFESWEVSATDCYMVNIKAQSMSKWDYLKRLAELVDSGNYYKFCKEARNVQSTDYGFGYEFNRIMNTFVQDNYAEFNNVSNLDEVQYYLGSMFTAEELAANKEMFSYLAFGRYIPRRKPEESPADYVARFKLASEQDCFDNTQKFSKVHHLSAIIFGAAVTKATFSNFRVANFIAGMFDAVIAKGTTKALSLLGISNLRYNLLSKSIRCWTYADFANSNVDALALLNAYYLTEADTALINTFDEMSKHSFIAEEKVTPISEIYNFDAQLMQNLQKVAAEVEDADLNGMVDEMRDWEFTKRYVERFAGE